MNKDAENEDEEPEEENIAKVKCICCKKNGHTEEKCPLDPNFRIDHLNSEEELKRITTADSDIISSKNQLEKTANFLK